MIRRALFGGAVALAAVLVVTQIAFAHSRPIRFDPPPGTVLTSAPVKVDGWFTSDIRRDPNWSFIHVADAQGNRVDSGDTALSTDRRMMTATLRPGLGTGRYLVTWRTLDDGDGAIFGDCYTFFVGQAAADAAVSDKARLDGGGACQRIDVSAKHGTPVPGVTPSLTTGGAAADDDEDMAASHGDSGSKGGIPTWALVLGVVGGFVVGGVGGRLFGSKS